MVTCPVCTELRSAVLGSASETGALRAGSEAESQGPACVNRDWKSPRVTTAGLLEGRYQVSFSVNSLQLILNSGSPGLRGGGGRSGCS